MRLLILFFVVLYTSIQFAFSGDDSIKQPIHVKAKQVNASSEELQWLTLDEAIEKNKTTPKKILVDVYTDWCGWCKKMDKQVYQNPEVVKALNQDYYVVKLNAEQLQPISVQGKTYTYKKQYRTHELALVLLNGEIGYPSTVFLNEKQRIIERVPGFIPAKDFLKTLAYLAEK